MIINIHIHLFTSDDIPDKFLPLKLVRYLATKKGFKTVSRILNWLNPLTTDNQFKKYISFIETGNLGSQKAIFEDVASQYPKDTKFVVLPMDMAYMGAGNVQRDYIKQLEELSDLAKENKNIIPFVHIDIRRSGYESLFKLATETLGFKGLKLYPPLGVFAQDERFNVIYKYCQTNNLPVIAHCTSGNPVHFKGSRKELIKLLNYNSSEDWKKSKADICAAFTHPSNYETILSLYPKLRICLAHFGRGTEWDKIILDMMDRHDNLWVDCSYSMSDEKLWSKFKLQLITNPQLRKRCLFGSDFYMVEMECTEEQFSCKLRVFLGEDIWNDISFNNPKVFLNI